MFDAIGKQAGKEFKNCLLFVQDHQRKMGPAEDPRAAQPPGDHKIAISRGIKAGGVLRKEGPVGVDQAVQEWQPHHAAVAVAGEHRLHGVGSRRFVAMIEQ